MSDQSRVVPVDREYAEAVIASLAQSAGLPVPTTAAEVIELLRAHDYDVTPRTLTEFVEKKYVSDPGDLWDSVSAFTFAQALESRRRWKPIPSRHDAKKSGARILIEQARAGGVAEPINDLDSVTIEDLLLRFVGCDSRADREVMFEALRLKLEHFEE